MLVLDPLWYPTHTLGLTLCMGLYIPLTLGLTLCMCLYIPLPPTHRGGENVRYHRRRPRRTSVIYRP